MIDIIDKQAPILYAIVKFSLKLSYLSKIRTST